MSKPRERPILFSGPMVRALLEGRKTQTRRLISPQPNFTPKDVDELTRPFPAAPLSDLVNAAWQSGFIKVPCPFGGPGDRLWVRETWYCEHCFERDYETTRRQYVGQTRTDAECEAEWVNYLHYRADGEAHEQLEQLEGSGRIWKPSIHMPRWASRLLLEVTEVRVQRLQEISEEDCRAESCAGGHDSIPGYEFSATPREHFRALWDSLDTSPGGDWSANPWVWAVSFRRVEGSR